MTKRNGRVWEWEQKYVIVLIEATHTHTQHMPQTLNRIVRAQSDEIDYRRMHAQKQAVRVERKESKQARKQAFQMEQYTHCIFLFF